MTSVAISLLVMPRATAQDLQLAAGQLGGVLR